MINLIFHKGLLQSHTYTAVLNTSEAAKQQNRVLLQMTELTEIYFLGARVSETFGIYIHKLCREQLGESISWWLLKGISSPYYAALHIILWLTLQVVTSSVSMM